MPNNIKVIGRIDLDALTARSQTRPQRSFFIQRVSASFWGNTPVELTMGNFGKKNTENTLFTLLLGRNGMGKSSLLRAIIDFMIEARTGKDQIKSKSVVVQSITYCLNGSFYSIQRTGKGFKYSVNLDECTEENMDYPHIVASTMSVFDKFPVATMGIGSRNNRYNVPFYQYIGPKATDNMFVSKTNSFLQTLSNLNNISSREQLTRINDLFKFLGYVPKVYIQYSFRKDYQSFLNNKKTQEILLDADVRSFMVELENSVEQTQRILVNFNRTNTLSSLRSLHLRELFLLRRAKLIPTLYCRFYRGDEFIDCENISSGEFNMLSIILNIIISRTERKPTLLLLDEPEISQHPNWQLEIIPNLKAVLEGLCCHVLVSTHSHFLVTNLPMKHSMVLNIYKDDENQVQSRIIDSETYGWSAEETLLKAFDMATDRSRYLAELIANLLNRISEDQIQRDDFESELQHLQKVSLHLSDVDPMKQIIKSIAKTYQDD